MRDQILKTALRMFNEKGYVEVGMRQIARQLDISPGNLTYHFKKKEDILVALLQDFSLENTGHYNRFSEAAPDIFEFLHLMRNILHTQFHFRGVYIGNQVVQAALLGNQNFEYKSVAAKRIESFRAIFSDLRNVGHLKVSDEDIEFLVSFITLFGRFWISEATLFNNNPDRQKTIHHYLSLLAKELSLFATGMGKEKIQRFQQEFI